MNDILADVPFRLHVEHRADGECVVVAGEVDLYAAPELDRSIRKCEEGGAKVIVLDLTEATLLDSITLGVLIAAHGRLAKQGVRLKLVFTNHLIRRVVTITGLDRVFDISSSTAAALNGQGLDGGEGALDGHPGRGARTAARRGRGSPRP
jgi:anti-sigma B factor antagonist